MNTVPVSVILPAHNAEQFIAEAIRSVQKQTVCVAEIIVVENVCSDRTGDIARELGATVIKEDRLGLSIARNAGIRAAAARWIAFLDTDDWWSPNKIELQWRAIQEFPEAALISCDNYFFKNGAVTRLDEQVITNRWRNLSPPPIRGETCLIIERPPGDMLGRFCPLSPSALIRRDVFDQVGFFDEELRYNDELECFMRIMARYQLAVVEQPLLYCRLHEHNRSRNIEGKQAAYVQMVSLMLKHPERYPPGAGEIEKKRVKGLFHTIERHISQAMT